MRRILAFIVALGVAGLGPLPASACAMLHRQPSECATPKTKTHCERMGVDHAGEPPVTVSNSSKSCCSISQAPAPETQTSAESFEVAAPPALTPSVVVARPPVESVWSPDIAQDSYPPPLQSLLCTFLI